jgi:Ca2+-transporting ATPase
MEVCTQILVNGEISRLTDEMKARILAENTEMAKNGIRVLGAAFRYLDSAELDHPDSYEQQLIYLGLIGMFDPVRPEAVDAVHSCQQAGIRVVMITGDHPLTALAIAKDLGVVENGKFLTGNDLSQMTVNDLKQQIDEISVFARVSPEHKMIIIDALQEEKQIVAMTGDGVNDAPALKSADIGVAMGITGTDVSKESSDMVLLDDNFATIVTAVKEGRRIYDNIRKFVKYILTGNAGEIIVMLTGPILGMPIPLLPIQILWINLVTDGIPAIALGYEEAERHVMERPPYNPEEGIFARGLGRKILTMGIIIGLLSVGVGFWFWTRDPDSRAWQTMVFTILTFCQMAYALCVRKQQQSLFTGLFRNKVMLVAVSVTLILQLALIYLPFFNTVFRTEPLSGSELAVCVLGAAVVIVITEIEKLLLRKRSPQ